MMSRKFWQWGLHLMFGFLLVFGVLRAWADGRLDARVLGLAVGLAAVYAAGRWVPRASKGWTTAWLGALCLLWLGLMVHAQDFMWLEFPLIFVFVRALPFWPGIIASVVLWAVAAFIPAWLHPQSWTVAAAVGPFIGTCFAVGVYYAARRMHWEAVHHAEIAQQLRETQAELAASERQAGRLAERERLSREIHDTVAQGLSSIVLLSRAAGKSTTLDSAHEQLQLIEQVARDNLSEARRFVRELAAPSVDLESTLRSLVEEANARAQALGQDLTVELATTGTAGVPTELNHVLHRVTQEGLNNVLKHAHARRTVVTLGCFDNEVTLDVVDDGQGISAPRGFGLTGLEQRVGGVGGTVTVESSPAGTALAVRIPRTRPAASAAPAERNTDG
ncbi:sensor histidine kinase [Corynebacterium sp.]|uniref:sensor histidine kinase n=1 Tax=Corynebacterium sp. TaxID=1720 RepID=UPI0026DB8D54|nr:sensor histidine kinase [Corynebacterium sp.]MDO5032619.1 sensor histidine kinase [Corynebacterium sp.]